MRKYLFIIFCVCMKYADAQYTEMPEIINDKKYFVKFHTISKERADTSFTTRYYTEYIRYKQDKPLQYYMLCNTECRSGKCIITNKEWGWFYSDGKIIELKNGNAIIYEKSKLKIDAFNENYQELIKSQYLIYLRDYYDAIFRGQINSIFWECNAKVETQTKVKDYENSLFEYSRLISLEDSCISNKYKDEKNESEYELYWDKIKTDIRYKAQPYFNPLFAHSITFHKNGEIASELTFEVDEFRENDTLFQFEKQLKALIGSSITFDYHDKEFKYYQLNSVKKLSFTLPNYNPENYNLVLIADRSTLIDIFGNKKELETALSLAFKEINTVSYLLYGKDSIRINPKEFGRNKDFMINEVKEWIGESYKLNNLFYPIGMALLITNKKGEVLYSVSGLNRKLLFKAVEKYKQLLISR